MPAVTFGWHVDSQYEPVAANAMDRKGVFATVLRRQHGGERADVRLLQTRWHFELGDRSVGQSAGHERVPDLSCPGDAKNVIHWTVVRVSDPDSGHQVG